MFVLHKHIAKMLSVYMSVCSLFTLLHLLLFLPVTFHSVVKTKNSRLTREDTKMEKRRKKKSSTKVWEKCTARSLPSLAVLCISVRHFIKHKFNLYSNFNFFSFYFSILSKFIQSKTRSLLPALFARSIFLLLFFFCPRYFSIYFASTTASRFFSSSFACVSVVFAVDFGPGHVERKKGKQQIGIDERRS